MSQPPASPRWGSFERQRSQKFHQAAKLRSREDSVNEQLERAEETAQLSEKAMERKRLSERLNRLLQEEAQEAERMGRHRLLRRGFKTMLRLWELGERLETTWQTITQALARKAGLPPAIAMATENPPQ